MHLWITNLQTTVRFKDDDELEWLSSFLTFADSSESYYTAGGESRFAGSKQRRLLNMRTNTFPSGLTALVRREAIARGHAVYISDRRARPADIDDSIDLDWLKERELLDGTPFQYDAVRRLLTRTRGLLHLPTGSGKTEIAVGLMKAVPDVRWLFLVPEADLLENGAKRWESRVPDEACGRAGVGKWPKGDPRVVFATYQTLAARLRDPLKAPALEKWLEQFTGLVVDECFPAGTLVGGRPIETIRAGDMVPSYDVREDEFVERRVLEVYEGPVHELVRLHFEAGSTLVCTPGHRFFTEDGWRPAVRLWGQRVLNSWREWGSPSWPLVARVETLELADDGKFSRACPGGKVYNLKVEGTETYLVNGFVVSNCHTLPAADAYRISMLTKNAYYRVGMSSTTLARGDSRNMYILASLGEVIYRVLPKSLMDAGWISRPTIRFVRVTQEKPKSKDYLQAYKQRIVRSKIRNDVLLRLAERASKPCLLFVKFTEHGRALTVALQKRGNVKAAFLHGKLSLAQRDSMLSDLTWGDLDVIVCTKVLQVGTDIPELASLVIGPCGASAIEAVQRVGRGMRVVHDDKGAVVKNTVEVWDIMDTDAKERSPQTGRMRATTMKWFEKHSRARHASYECEGYTTTVLSPLEGARYGSPG